MKVNGLDDFHDTIRKRGIPPSVVWPLVRSDFELKNILKQRELLVGENFF